MAAPIPPAALPAIIFLQKESSKEICKENNSANNNNNNHENENDKQYQATRNTYLSSDLLPIELLTVHRVPL